MGFRRAARIDKNQNEVVEALREFGATVLPCHQLKNAFDLLVGYEGQLFIMEVKSKGGKLTEGEDKCRADFERVDVPYYVVFSSEEAISILEKSNISKEKSSALETTWG